jgi:4-diphosphocytidyl-2-C-methyl-D-erythritol kinase
MSSPDVERYGTPVTRRARVRSPAMSRQRWLAPAKLTLELRVTGVRDDGFHLLDAEMVTLDLADVVEIRPLDRDPLDVDRPGTSGSVQVEAAAGVPVIGVPTDGENLVLRALRMTGRRAEVRLTKHIPPGAGLGGGSSDAAAIFRWAGFSDAAEAARLGADIPFCLIGGRARVTGIGEVLEPLPFVARTVTLLTPAFGCDTKAVFAAWDRLGGPSSDGTNDLEAAALAAEPRLAQTRDQLGHATGATPMLAGSGSTWFVDGAFPGEGRVVAATTPAFDPDEDADTV